MIKPDEKISRALYNLQDNSNFEVVAKWIHDSMIDISLKNNKCTGETTIKNQGRALVLEEMLVHIEQAGSYVNNYRKTREEKHEIT